MGYGTNGLTFNTLRDANTARLNETLKFEPCLRWTPSQWLQALVGEIGEYANILKKVERGDFTLDVAREAIGKELADVQVYLDLLALKVGVDLGRATMAKFNEVSVRVGSDIRIAADDWHRDDGGDDDGIKRHNL